MSRVFCLSFHAGYGCRRRGACCTSGWAIPVETPIAARLAREMDAGALAAARGVTRAVALVSRGDLPDGFAAVLGTDALGRCAFHESEAGGACAIQRQRGHAWLPAACRHFPRVVLLDARGAHLTFSHYCPTAASLLFHDDRVADVVEAPVSLTGIGEPEGFDARGVLPPLLHPGVLMDVEGYAAWERHAVRTLARAGDSAEAALGCVAAAAERIRLWTPGGRSLAGTVDAVCSSPGVWRSAHPGTPEPANLRPDWRSLDGGVRQCVPPFLTARPAPERADEAWNRWVAREWPAFAAPVGRYLAAKAFASWVAYQGRGLRTIVRSLEAALAVVRAEAARAAAAAARPLDADLLNEAFRAADLLLVHLASREALAERWSAAEIGPAEPGSHGRRT